VLRLPSLAAVDAMTASSSATQYTAIVAVWCRWDLTTSVLNQPTNQPINQSINPSIKSLHDDTCVPCALVGDRHIKTIYTLKTNRSLFIHDTFHSAINLYTYIYI